MNSKPNLSSRWWPALVCVVLMFSGLAATAASDLKFEALLIWATDATKSPNPHQKPVDADVRKKLNDLPLRWQHYFVVKRVGFLVPSGGSQDEVLSPKCQIVVKDIDGRRVEVSLIGRGQPVLKRTQRLPMGDMLVLGGNAPNETGWLVVLKRKQ